MVTEETFYFFVLIFFFLKKKQQQGGERGVQVIPNLAFWMSLPGLIWDGVKWSVSTLFYKIRDATGGSSGYPYALVNAEADEDDA